MIDYNKEIFEALSDILPTYYELFTDGPKEKPCITYQEAENSDAEHGETFGFSDIEFLIKVWADSKADIETNALKVDKVMRPLGFHRVSTTELFVDYQVCKIMRYLAKGIETYESEDDSDEE